MAEEVTLRLTQDEALVLADYLHRWSETDNAAFIDEAERTALDNLLSVLEKADDGTAFAADYDARIAAARERLRPPKT